MTANYFCGHCDAPLAGDASRCPHCGAALARIRCPACRYVGTRVDFSGDRCPKCGCRRLIVA